MPSQHSLGIEGLTYAATQLLLDRGALTRVAALPALINPETMNSLGIAGLAADVAPSGAENAEQSDEDEPE